MPAGVFSARNARSSDGVKSRFAAFFVRGWREAEKREPEVMVIGASVRIVSGEENYSDETAFQLPFSPDNSPRVSIFWWKRRGHLPFRRQEPAG